MRCKTPRLCPDSAPDLLHLFTLEGTMEQGVDIIASPLFSKVGSQFTKFKKK